MGGVRGSSASPAEAALSLENQHMARDRPLSRSEQMSRIRAQDTAPEWRLRRALWAAGLRYRVRVRTVVGKPDLVFLGPRVAVFIDGCFWHGCPRHYVRPGSRVEFWAQKLRINVDRDRAQTLELEALGWMVVRVWEHEVYEVLAEVVDRVRRAAKGDRGDDVPDWRVVRVEEIDRSRRLERRHLEALREPALTRVEEGRRVTAKWRRPCGS